MNMDMTKHFVRVYRVDPKFFECIDGNQCVKVLVNQDSWTEEQKVAYSHVAEGTVLMVQRDFRGNIIRWAPLPRDDQFASCVEENPREDTDPKPHMDPDDIS